MMDLEELKRRIEAMKTDPVLSKAMQPIMDVTVQKMGIADRMLQITDEYPVSMDDLIEAAKLYALLHSFGVTSPTEIFDYYTERHPVMMQDMGTDASVGGAIAALRYDADEWFRVLEKSGHPQAVFFLRIMHQCDAESARGEKPSRE